MVVQTLTDSLGGTTAAPSCVQEGFTGETTNFNLVAGSCTAFGGSSPGIRFTEVTNSPGIASTSRPINAISRGPGSIDIFYRSTDGTVHTNDLSGSGWGVDNSIGGSGVGYPVAVPRGPGHIDAFAIGNNGEVLTADWAGGATWTAWWPLLSGNFSTGLVGLSRDGSLIDIFGSSQGTLTRDAWDGQNWNPAPLQQGNSILGAPSVVSWGPRRMDVFARGTDQGLYTKSWDGTTWYDYFAINRGVQFTGNPSAVSRSSNSIDVFVRGTDGKLYTTSWDGGPEWDAYTRLSDMQFIGDPYAVSWGPNRIDVFVEGTDQRLHTMTWDGGPKWIDFSLVGPELIAGDPSAVSWGPNRIDVFVRGTDGRVYTKALNGKTWDTNYTGLGGSL
jgi:hypothetical protein